MHVIGAIQLGYLMEKQTGSSESEWVSFSVRNGETNEITEVESKPSILMQKKKESLQKDYLIWVEKNW